MTSAVPDNITSVTMHPLSYFMEYAAIVPLGCTDVCAICSSVVDGEDYRLQPDWHCGLEVICVPCDEAMIETRERLRARRWAQATGDAA